MAKLLLWSFNLISSNDLGFFFSLHFSHFPMFGYGFEVSNLWFYFSVRSPKDNHRFEIWKTIWKHRWMTKKDKNDVKNIKNQIVT
jgi:hypothetical protein